MKFLRKIFGDPDQKYLKKLQPLVDEINNLEPRFKSFSNEELSQQTKEFKSRLKNGETLDEILPSAFAAVREMSMRTLHQRHYDVQIMAGIVIHRGNIAEMKTGEGKTLAATMPIYLNALSGEGVHIVTVNDYLARRDTVWMGQIYYKLGLSVACINHEQSFLYDPAYKKLDQEKDKIRDELGSFYVVEDFLRPISRAEAYQADILYGTNNEFGFDYLRDNIATSVHEQVQRAFNFAVLDEVDSILIDEARTPLIISTPDYEASKMYSSFSRIILRLKPESHYKTDEKTKTVSLTEEGIEKVEDILGVHNIYQEKGIKYLHHLEQALRAQVFFKKDRDYIVKDGEVIIVDEFTGRLMPGRRYSGGLHQAIEAKEGLRVKPESKTLASITFQNFFRKYKKLAGMTGTAKTSEEEFREVYGMDVYTIPTNKPMIRKDLNDRIYRTQMGKFKAIVAEIKDRHQKGQPVLLGTTSIEKNELISRMLSREGVEHKVLNAKNNKREGEVIAQAGKKGAVTVATNMAGRGVDIILGGNPPDPQEAEEVKKLGGLHVIGAQRHEARRIDDQLRGRSGRQGDPGSSRFFVSLEDSIVRIFGGEKISNIMSTLKVPEDQPIESGIISNAIERAQQRVEGANFDLRKYILQYDDVISKHRDKIYYLRSQILRKKYDELREYILGITKEDIENITNAHFSEEGIDTSGIFEEMKTIIPVGENIRIEIGKIGDRDKLVEFLYSLVSKAFKAKEENEGKEGMDKIIRFICLKSIDFLWSEHLQAMDYLKDMVKLRAYGGRDPLVEYKTEGHRLFQNLIVNMNSQITRSIFKLSIKQ